MAFKPGRGINGGLRSQTGMAVRGTNVGMPYDIVGKAELIVSASRSWIQHGKPGVFPTSESDIPQRACVTKRTPPEGSRRVLNASWGKALFPKSTRDRSAFCEKMITGSKRLLGPPSMGKS